MDPSAQVHSLDALRDLRTALIKFREEASNALTAVDVEVRHGLEWISHDLLKQWQQEFRKREDAVGECKTALARCQLMKLPSGETPTCDDEKKQLRIAKMRVEEAAEKIKLVKKWTQILEQEAIEYRGPAQQLDLLVQSDLVAGVADLDGRIRSLEAYLQTLSEGVDMGLPQVTSEASLEEKKDEKK